MRARHWMGIAWPAFLTACVLEMLVFALVDPGDLHGFGGQALPWSRQAVYTLAFFVFWAVTLASSALSVALTSRANDSPPGGSDLSRRSAD